MKEQSLQALENWSRYMQQKHKEDKKRIKALKLSQYKPLIQAWEEYRSEWFVEPEKPTFEGFMEFLKDNQ